MEERPIPTEILQQCRGLQYEEQIERLKALIRNSQKLDTLQATWIMQVFIDRFHPTRRGTDAITAYVFFAYRFGHPLLNQCKPNSEQKTLNMVQGNHDLLAAIAFGKPDLSVIKEISNPYAVVPVVSPTPEQKAELDKLCAYPDHQIVGHYVNKVVKELSEITAKLVQEALSRNHPSIPTWQGYNGDNLSPFGLFRQLGSVALHASKMEKYKAKEVLLESKWSIGVSIFVVGCCRIPAVAFVGIFMFTTTFAYLMGTSFCVTPQIQSSLLGSIILVMIGEVSGRMLKVNYDSGLKRLNYFQAQLTPKGH